jgi:MFS family permease
VREERLDSARMPHSSAVTASGEPWYAELSSACWRTLALAGAAWTFDVFDSFLLSLTLPALVAAFSLSKADAGAIGSILAAGLVFGGIAFGWVADRIGRVRSLVICVALYSCFSGATAFAPSASWVAILRFCAGLGMGGAWTSGAALVAETWPSKYRGRGGALMQMGLPIGSMLAIGAAAIVDRALGGMDGIGWRVMYIVGVLPIVVVAFIARKTPESPLWRQRARSQLSQGSLRDALSGANVRGLLRALGFVFCCQYIYWGVFTWTPTFLIAVKHLNFLHSLGFVMSQQVGSLCGFLVFAAIVDRIGRRPSFLIYLLIGAISVGIFVVAEGQVVLYVAIFWTGFGITGLFAGMGPFTAELVPNSGSRGLSMGIAYNAGRLGGILAPYLIGTLATSADGFQLGMGTNLVAFVLAAIVIKLSPETKGIQLS